MKANNGTLQEANKISIYLVKQGLTSSYVGITANFFPTEDHHRHCVTLAMRWLEFVHTGAFMRSLANSSVGRNLLRGFPVDSAYCEVAGASVQSTEKV